MVKKVKTQIAQLKEHPENPRRWDEMKLEEVKKGLLELPEMSQARPLVVNKKNQVIGGNMRLAAMKEMGWKTVEVIRVDWSNEQQKEFLVKDNAEYGAWDFEKLMNEWEPEFLQKAGLDVFGFMPEDGEEELSEIEKEIEDEEVGSPELVKSIAVEVNEEQYEGALELAAKFRENYGLEAIYRNALKKELNVNE